MGGPTGIRDTLLLIAAGVVAFGGVAAVWLARRYGRSSPLPVPGLSRLSAPTHAVIGFTMVVIANQLAAPVFGWPGLLGPGGALLALGLVASAGSVWIDLAHADETDPPDRGDAP